MNADQLLDIIGSARDRYVADALAPVKAKPRLRLNRLVLIAALLAVTMLLAGCVAVVLHLRDLQVARDTVAQDRDIYGNLQEECYLPVNILYLHTPGNEALAQAAGEWYEFTQSYDADHSIRAEFEDDGFSPDNSIFLYSCWNEEMEEKLREIAEKHGLQLLDEGILAQSYQKDIFYQSLGIQGLIRPGAQVEVDDLAGSLHRNGSFDTEMLLTLTGEDAWPKEIYAQVTYAKDDCFAPRYFTIIPEDARQWNYTASDGTTVLLVREADGTGYLYAGLQNAAMMIDLDPGHLGPGPFPRDEKDLPDGQVLEQIAEIFDYSIFTRPVDGSRVRSLLDAREAEHQEQMKELGKNALATPECAEYGEFINTLNYPAHWSYALLDVNSDGVEDLFLTIPGFTRIMTLRDGKVEELYQEFGSLLPCKDGFFQANDHYDIPGENSYYRFNGDSMEHIEGLMYRDGTWRHGRSDVDNGYSYPVSQEAAQAVRDKYTPLDILRPCTDFPMNGTTLGEIIAAEPLPTEQELRSAFAAFVDAGTSPSGSRGIADANYYTLRDVTGDGQEDLLLSIDGETICAIASWHRGRIIRRTSSEYHLRSENVLESIGYGRKAGGETIRHDFTQFREDQGYDLGYFTYVRDSDSWENIREEPIPGTDYEELAAKYPPVELDFHPIEELTGK